MTNGAESIQGLCPQKRGSSGADLLAGFAEAVPVPVLLLTPDMRIRCANAALVRVLGIATEHYLHRKIPSHWLVDPRESLPRLSACLHELARTGIDPEPIRLSLRSSAGSEIRTRAHVRPLPGLQNGLSDLTVVTFEAVGQDVAELKEAQEQLRCSEERFRVIYECAPDAYYLCDLRGRFIDGNRAAEKMVGCSREELLGRSFLTLNLLPKSQIPKAASALVKNAVGRPTGPDEFTLNCRDGSQLTIEVRTHPVRLQGQVLVLGIARDVTARKRAKDELLDSEAKYRELHESSRDGCVATDMTGAILECNTAYQEMTGYSAEELCRVTYDEITPPKWHEPEAKIIREQVLTRGYSELYEKEYIHKDGTVFPIELRAYLKKDRTGQPIGMWAIVRDITERKKSQVMLEKLNGDLETTVHELERSNKELAEFAHVTAHDLKAPLRGISIVADWLAQDYAEQIDERGRESLELLRSRVARMTDLINGILRYSEIGHGEQDIEMLDTHALVGEIFEQVAPPEHIALRIEGQLPTVPGERVRLTQVFQNLISNAVKYIDKREGHVTVSAAPHEDGWEFAIADNGSGIEAKHFGRIFKMFQTLSDSDRCDSTGLGLAVVKKIVDLYGGRVWLESEVGVGSTFHFTLPAERKVDASASG